MSNGRSMPVEMPPGRAQAPAHAAEAALMQDFLAKLAPRSGSEALRALRAAFPTASLAARVAAMAQHAGEA